MTKFFDLFAPPEGFVGDFGWICGFTAGDRVMREIADRFTQGAGVFEATHRRPALLLVTDAASAQITSVRAVHHMTVKPDWANSFNGGGLFHAKVALLHFAEELPCNRPTRRHKLRLIVSTGNWTIETVQANIDLFWQTEVTLGDAADIDVTSLSDILEAHAMFKVIRKHLAPNPWPDPTSVSAPYAQLDTLLDRVPTPDATPRFFHSLTKPLGSGLLKSFSVQERPELLLLGSGFYAGGDPAVMGGDGGKGGAAGFLRDLAGKLIGKHEGCTIAAILNPLACQGLATSVQGSATPAVVLKGEGWTFYQPRFPDDHVKDSGKLHAKFIYRGKLKKLNGLLYIGSGNLTPAGLGQGKHWNFEAGVILTVKDNAKPCDLLPWDGAREVDLDYGLEAGDAFERTTLFDAGCPISHFGLREAQGQTWLDPQPQDSDIAAVSFCHSGGDWQRLRQCIELKPKTPPPTLVQLRYPGGEMAVPVLSESGAMVLPNLHFLRIEDVLSALSTFDYTGREADSSEVDDGQSDDQGGKFASSAVPAGAYDTRRLMMLITLLGESQASLRPEQSRLWATRFIEQASGVFRTEDSDFFELLKRLKINPFAHLGQPEFMPLRVSEEEARFLTEAHTAVARLWGVADFEGFCLEQ